MIQYIFKKWEDNLQVTKELEISNITIEHIKPQSSKLLKDSVGLMGNLLPLSGEINNLAATKSFNEKIKIYKKSNLKIIQDFVQINQKKADWAKNDIIKRSEEIAKKSYYDIWAIR